MCTHRGIRVGRVVALTAIALAGHLPFAGALQAQWSEPQQITNGIEVNTVQFLPTPRCGGFLGLVAP